MHIFLVQFIFILFWKSISSHSNDVNNVVSMFQKDEGSFTSCGPKESNFMLKWSPRVIEADSEMTFDFSLTAIETLERFNLTVTVWTENVPDPIYVDSGVKTCEDVEAFLHKYLPDFKCPIPKGYTIKRNNYKVTIPPSFPLPTGKYIISADVKNLDGATLVCAKGNVEIAGE